MGNSKLTGFEILYFISSGHMTIIQNPETGETTLHTSDELAEALTEQIGFEISSETLNNILLHFAEFASTAEYTLSPSEEGSESHE